MQIFRDIFTLEDYENKPLRLNLFGVDKNASETYELKKDVKYYDRDDRKWYNSRLIFNTDGIYIIDESGGYTGIPFRKFEFFSIADHDPETSLMRISGHDLIIEDKDDHDLLCEFLNEYNKRMGTFIDEAIIKVENKYLADRQNSDISKALDEWLLSIPEDFYADDENISYLMHCVALKSSMVKKYMTYHLIGDIWNDKQYSSETYGYVFDIMSSGSQTITSHTGLSNDYVRLYLYLALRERFAR